MVGTFIYLCVEMLCKNEMRVLHIFSKVWFWKAGSALEHCMHYLVYSFNGFSFFYGTVSFISLKVKIYFLNFLLILLHVTWVLQQDVFRLFKINTLITITGLTVLSLLSYPSSLCTTYRNCTCYHNTQGTGTWQTVTYFSKGQIPHDFD